MRARLGLGADGRLTVRRVSSSSPRGWYQPAESSGPAGLAIDGPAGQVSDQSDAPRALVRPEPPGRLGDADRDGVTAHLRGSVLVSLALNSLLKL